MEGAIRHMNFDIPGIKAIYAGLKKDRKVLTWGEFADNVGYDRTYVSRVINGHEPLTEDFQKKVKEYVNTTKIVPPETDEDAIRQDQGDKPPMTYTDISTTDSSAEMAHTAGQDQRPQTLEEAVRAFLNVSEAINKQADVLVKLAGLIPNGPQKP